MEAFKVCPTCNTKNSLANYMCDVCLSDISAIQKKEKMEQSLQLIKEDENIYIEVFNGDYLGREHVGKEILSSIKTVSRKHVIFIYENKSWHMEDLNSSNGVYINDMRVKPNMKVIVENNDKISLSLSFHAIVTF